MENPVWWTAGLFWCFPYIYGWFDSCGRPVVGATRWLGHRSFLCWWPPARHYKKYLRWRTLPICRGTSPVSGGSDSMLLGRRSVRRRSDMRWRLVIDSTTASRASECLEKRRRSRGCGLVRSEETEKVCKRGRSPECPVRWRQTSAAAPGKRRAGRNPTAPSGWAAWASGDISEAAAPVVVDAYSFLNIQLQLWRFGHRLPCWWALRYSTATICTFSPPPYTGLVPHPWSVQYAGSWKTFWGHLGNISWLLRNWSMSVKHWSSFNWGDTSYCSMSRQDSMVVGSLLGDNLAMGLMVSNEQSSWSHWYKRKWNRWLEIICSKPNLPGIGK